MRTLIRAAIVGTLGLFLAAMVSLAADPAPVPEWHQDLEYLTWDRGLDAPSGVDGRQVFLHPTDEALAMELGGGHHTGHPVGGRRGDGFPLRLDGPLGVQTTGRDHCLPADLDSPRPFTGFATPHLDRD
jgi:hypothetical protein